MPIVTPTCTARVYMHSHNETHTARVLCRYEWCDIDEGVEVVSELVEEVTEISFSIVYSHYLEEQAFPHSVNDAKHSLLKIIEVTCLNEDVIA